ncbi:phage portal protein [Ruminococcus bicirculans (ex Wegman et al. 2014)]|uniref:phage portal protein n=2 Tax=Ruminococcus TaxID=1263 RepID=UPI00307BDC39
MGSSTAGKNVTEHSAMQMTAVYSCVRILSEAVAGLPLHLYKYTDTGSAKATNHPLYALLHDGPNPEMTSFMFLETLMTHLLLWGNAYAQIIRNGKGEVVVIYPLMPDRMTVDRDENGMLYYEYQTNSGDAPVNKQSTVRLAPTDVLHIAGLGFDGLGAAGEFLGNAKAVSLLAIEKIKSGDKVISTDPETMETSPKIVLETYIREVTTLVHLTVNGEEIVTTVDHPFYVKNQGFIKAGELIVGDELLDVNGNVLLVENFAVELTDEPTTVYNFQVEDFHTYYVGKNGILVHNADYSTVVTPDMENKILEGERVGSSNRIKGGHSPQINDANPKYSVEVQQTFPDGTKKIKFITEFPDGNVSKIKTSTIFPDNWSDAKIIDSIKQVGDGVPIGKRIADNSYLYRDIIDGVQIEVIKQGNNVIAGYPTGGGTTGLPTGFTSK